MHRLQVLHYLRPQPILHPRSYFFFVTVALILSSCNFRIVSSFASISLLSALTTDSDWLANSSFQWPPPFLALVKRSSFADSISRLRLSVSSSGIRKYFVSGKLFDA